MKYELITIENLKNISKESSVEGYIWLSNDNKPVMNDEILPEICKLSDNPFIVEGFFKVNEEYSYSIRYVDGKYKVAKFNLSDFSKEDLIEYEAHSRLNVKKVKYYELWEPEADEYCCGMDVLRFKALVFAGFTK